VIRPKNVPPFLLKIAGMVIYHGLSRFPVFVQFVKDGLVNPAAEPVKEAGLGAIEQWNGNFGPGMLNAGLCMNRAMELANMMA